MMNPLLAPELLKARHQKLMREAELDRLARTARADVTRAHAACWRAWRGFLPRWRIGRRARLIPPTVSTWLTLPKNRAMSWLARSAKSHFARIGGIGHAR